jgi:hypothetical protein
MFGLFAGLMRGAGAKRWSRSSIRREQERITKRLEQKEADRAGRGDGEPGKADEKKTP